jgi:hypothetical protein
VAFEKALTEELEKVLPDAVYPLVAPEGTPLPFIVYASSYGDRDLTLDGYQINKEIEVSVQVVASSYFEMKQYTNTMIDALIALKVMGTDRIPVQHVHYEKPHESVDPVTFHNHSITDFTFRI